MYKLRFTPMKWLISLLVVLGLFSVPNLYAEESSLSLYNAGFEEPLVNGEIPGWTQTYGTGGFSVTDTKVYEGDHSLQLTDTDDTQSFGVVSDKINITAGDLYTVSAKVYTEHTSPSLYLYFYDESGRQIEQYAEIYRVDQLETGDWITISLEGSAPPEAKHLNVLLYTSTLEVGTLYFDQIEISSEKQLHLEFGAPISLGDAVQVPLTQGMAKGQNVLGENEVYFATNGAPATFNVVDAETGKLKFSEPLPGLDVVWAVVRAPDGDVYFGSTKNGKLLRYLPDKRRIEDLGLNPSGRFIWDLEASNDGKIYGAVYPGASIFEYDIATGTFEDFGNMKEGQEYVRGIGLTDDYLYAGIGTDAYVFRIDLQTREQEEVILPITGESGFIANVQIYNQKLLVQARGYTLFVIDEITGEHIRTIPYDSAVSPPNPNQPELVYYKHGTELFSYNLSTDQITKIDGIPELPETVMRNFDWLTLNHGDQAGRTVLAGMMNSTEYFLYDPQDNSLQMVHLEAVSQGVAVKSLETGPDGKLYVGGYQLGMSIIDPDSGQVEYNLGLMPQPEGIGFLNGKAYFGTYGGAVIYRYDPDLPFLFGKDDSFNPGLVIDIEDGQDRPFTFASGDDQLFIGTVPGYGFHGGALTIYNEDNDTWTVHRNVVENQSIIGLAYQDGILFGGTSIWGGLGDEPIEEEAKIFVWDVENGKKIAEFTPDISGIDVTPKMIGELSFGPDGLLWGSADGTIFAMDPETYNVVKSKVIYPSTYARSGWLPNYLRWGEDGILYTTVGGKLTAIDPETLATKLIRNNTLFMTLGENGAIYYANGAQIHKLPVPLEEIQMTVESPVWQVGQTSSLHLSGVLKNGMEADLSKAEIEYVISDPSVLTIQDGVVQANGIGLAEVKMIVTLDGQTLESNVVNIEVGTVPDSPALLLLVEQLAEEGEFSQPAAASALSLHLKAVSLFEKQGELDKALRHMNGFKFLLAQQNENESISQGAFQILMVHTDALIEMWEEE